MGGEWSYLEREPSPDPWWANAQPSTSRNVLSRAGEDTENKEDERTCEKVKDEEMDAFKQEIIRKRELRHAAISSIQNEMKKLRSDLAEERTLRKAAEEERDNLIKVKSNDALLQQVEKLKQDLEEEINNKKAIEEERDRLKEKENELEAVEQQVRALKEVTTIGKEMLKIRELQVKELKKKLEEIEIILPNAPEGLRLEYEQQIQNIHKLRELYEQRALATRTQHQQERERDEAKINMLEVKVNELQEEIQEHKDKTAGFEEKILHFEGDIEEKTNQIETLQDQLYSSNLECRSLKSQMKIINDLFSQVLAGPEFDLDRLTRLLKENHGLITDLTTMGDSNEVAALLIDIAEKADGETILGIKEKEEGDVSVCKEKEEIAANLSKVWRVLVELLSHHKEVSRNNAGSESCYKSVDTPSGPRLVISVSQTYLTLKDLILEKNSLVKEVGRLKTLNGHLETRMHSQERRLSIVSTELKKTWSVVSKLRAQHKQLHNHEKILRYELQHKRQMLTELKQELEHCREKWDRARQKKYTIRRRLETTSK
uniref:Uncharacterized protein n=1 Tax=Clastoptera arizonana TaxID=38151 RepID=A0A1B6DFJ3_9HEMI